MANFQDFGCGQLEIFSSRNGALQRRVGGIAHFACADYHPWVFRHNFVVGIVKEMTRRE
jgi:hypothetical protein